MKKLIIYIKESLAELKKVTWPSKKQVTNYSIVVVAMSIGGALFFGILDYFLNKGLTWLI